MLIRNKELKKDLTDGTWLSFKIKATYRQFSINEVLECWKESFQEPLNKEFFQQQSAIDEFNNIIVQSYP